MSSEAPDFNQPAGEGSGSEAKGSKVALILAALGLANIMATVIIVIVIVLMPLIALASLKERVFGFLGLDDEPAQALIDKMPDEVVDEMEKHQEDMEQLLDCSNRPVDERKPGDNCIEGLIGSGQGASWSPVPESANWLVPVWQAAGNRYGVPWELLAALNGARTSFGARICDSGSISGGGSWQFGKENDPFLESNSGQVAVGSAGVGFYRMPARRWLSNSTNAGYAKRITDSTCDTSASPARVYKDFKKPLKKLTELKKEKDSLNGSPTDAVHATFAMARDLARQGAWKREEWKYKGSGPGQCTITDRAGKITYPPVPPAAGGAPGVGAKYGFNPNLKIPRKAVVLAAKYRSNKGKWRPQATLAAPSIPPAHTRYFLQVSWAAMGAKGADLRRNVALNFKQVGLESGGSPGLIQVCDGTYYDPNCLAGNPAKGMMQFIPSTFATWKVSGFNDIFNPLDNILAAVNAQAHSEMGYILDGSQGWGPSGGSNPYTKGGKATKIANGPSGSSSEPLPAMKYKGKEQKDPISKAVRSNADGMADDCYVAVIHDWYKLIKKYPPTGAMTVSGPVRQRIVKIAQAELAKGAQESGSDNNPRYTKAGGKVAPYSIVPEPWCQAFAAWVWYQAGIKNMTQLGGMTQAGGLTLPASTGAVTAAAQAGQYGMKYKTSNPQPGDMLFYSDTHVEIVSKVAGGKVIESIGGNTSDGVTKVAPPSGYTHFVSPPVVAGKSSYDLGGGLGDVEAGDWVRVGATAYTETTTWDRPKYKGNTYAELLVAGANAGLARQSLASVFKINSKEWVGMPMGTALLVRLPGKKKVFKIYKIDNGSGQGGDPKYKIDLSMTLLRKMGFTSVSDFGRRDVEIALVKRKGRGGR